MLRFSPQQQKAIVDACHRAGITVQTHQGSVETLRSALEAGVDMVQHGSTTGPVPMPDDVLQLMVDRKVASAWDYPQTVRRATMDLERAQNADPPDTLAIRRMRAKEENIVRMIKAGVPLLLGTDQGVIDPDVYAPMPAPSKVDWVNVMGEGHFLWMRAMVERGWMTPMEAIEGATRRMAAGYYKLDKLGTV